MTDVEYNYGRSLRSLISSHRRPVCRSYICEIKQSESNYAQVSFTFGTGG